jgi:hypothetical protein
VVGGFRSCRPRPLGLAASAALLYPVVVVAALYGEWLLAWHVLGHPPRPSLDDPKGIPGSSWMHAVTALAVLGTLPAAFAALALNATHLVMARPSAVRGVARLVALSGLWLALFALLRWDPWQVGYWWMD